MDSISKTEETHETGHFHLRKTEFPKVPMGFSIADRRQDMSGKAYRLTLQGQLMWKAVENFFQRLSQLRPSSRIGIKKKRFFLDRNGFMYSKTNVTKKQDIVFWILTLGHLLLQKIQLWEAGGLDGTWTDGSAGLGPNGLMSPGNR